MKKVKSFFSKSYFSFDKNIILSNSCAFDLTRFMCEKVFIGKDEMCYTKMTDEYKICNLFPSKQRWITWSMIMFIERPTCMLHKWRQDFTNIYVERSRNITPNRWISMLAGRCIKCHEPCAPSCYVVAMIGIGGQRLFFPRYMSGDLVYELIATIIYWSFFVGYVLVLVEAGSAFQDFRSSRVNYLKFNKIFLY